MGDMDSKSRTSWKEVEGEEGGSERGGEGGRKGGREGGKEGGLNVPNHAPGPGAVHLLQVKLCVFHGHTGSSHGEVGEAGLREGGREGGKEGGEDGGCHVDGPRDSNSDQHREEEWREKG